MTQVTYNGAQPVLTPTLAADGEVTLGVWQPGESKDVPDEMVEGLCAQGSAFSAASAEQQAQQQAEQEPAPGEAQSMGMGIVPLDAEAGPPVAQAQSSEKPRRSLLARARGEEA